MTFSTSRSRVCSCSDSLKSACFGELTSSPPFSMADDRLGSEVLY